MGTQLLHLSVAVTNMTHIIYNTEEEETSTNTSYSKINVVHNLLIIQSSSLPVSLSFNTCSCADIAEPPVTDSQIVKIVTESSRRANDVARWLSAVNVP